MWVRRTQFTDETTRQRAVDFSAEPEVKAGDHLVSSPPPTIRAIGPSFPTGVLTVANDQVVFSPQNLVVGLFRYICSASTASGQRLAIPCELEVPY
jgi:hypothetical protein